MRSHGQYPSEKRYRVLKRMFPDVSSLRFRASERPPTFGQLPLNDRLEFKSMDIVSTLPIRVTAALGNSTVGNALDEMLALRYAPLAKESRAMSGRRRVRASCPGEEDVVWDLVLSAARSLRRHTRRPMIDDRFTLQYAARICVVLARHAAVDKKPELMLDEGYRHSQLATADLRELVEMARDEEVEALTQLYELATVALPDPTVLRRAKVEVRCGHGYADLLLDQTLIEVKTSPSTQFGAAMVYPLIGKALSLPPTLNRGPHGGVQRVGWYFARYGVLWDFPIGQALTSMAGKPTTLQHARAEFYEASAKVGAEM